jgi:hypothetical protein
MPLNPSPIIDANLCLITQPITRPDIARAALLTFSTESTGTPGASLAQTVVDHFQTDFNAAFSATFDSEVTLQPPSIKLGAGTDVPYEAIATGAAVSGGRAGTFLPPNVALLVKKLTSLGGKKNRGRTYFPFFLDDADVNENGTLATGVQAAFQTLMNSFVNALAADSIPMVISHKIFNVPLPPHFVTHVQAGALITAYNVEPMIGTQRRRLNR